MLRSYRSTLSNSLRSVYSGVESSKPTRQANQYSTPSKSFHYKILAF